MNKPIQISDSKWNEATWAVEGYSYTDEFTLSLAFDTDTLHLSVSESKRLRDALTAHLEACGSEPGDEHVNYITSQIGAALIRGTTISEATHLLRSALVLLNRSKIDPKTKQN